MDILCSADTGVCHLAAEVSADFIKVGEKKPTQRNNKNPIPYLSLLHLLSNADEFLINLTIFILQCECSSSSATLTE